MIQTTDVASSRPKQMIIEIELPKLDSAADLDLDVQVTNGCAGCGCVILSYNTLSIFLTPLVKAHKIDATQMTSKS